MRLPTHTASITSLAKPMAYCRCELDCCSQSAMLVEGLRECEALLNAGETG